MFWHLSTDRTISLGFGGAYTGDIPAASIDRAAAQFPGEEEAFTACMRAMDRAYLKISRRDPKAHRVRKDRMAGPDMLRSISK